jgi:hypothetical protein
MLGAAIIRSSSSLNDLVKEEKELFRVQKKEPRSIAFF